MKTRCALLVSALFVVAPACRSSESARLDAGGDANGTCYSQRGVTLDCPAHPDAVFSYYFKVCGADGKTYQTWEEAECACVAYTSGSCDPAACSMGDPGPPVCGKDGKTYPGDLTAGCYGALRASMGPCPDGGQT